MTPHRPNQHPEPEEPEEETIEEQEPIRTIPMPPKPAKPLPPDAKRNPYIQKKNYDAAIERAREKEIAQRKTDPFEEFQEEVKPGRLARLRGNKPQKRYAGKIPLSGILIALASIVSAASLAVVIASVFSVTGAELTATTGGAVLGWANSFGVIAALVSQLLIVAGLMTRRRSEDGINEP